MVEDPLLVAALCDVVRQRGWVFAHAERDVYTAELVGQGVVARLDRRGW
jgi:hypothetical protein